MKLNQSSIVQMCIRDSFHTTKRDYKVRGNIGDVEKELEKYNFVRIHRSYIVNLKYVNKVLSVSLIHI